MKRLRRTVIGILVSCIAAAIALLITHGQHRHSVARNTMAPPHSAYQRNTSVSNQESRKPHHKPIHLDAGNLLAKITAALDLREPARTNTIVNLLESSGQHPEACVSIAKTVFSRVPQKAGEYGSVLCGALIRNGSFSTAFEIAQLIPGATRTAETENVLQAWAANRPDEAGTLADSVQHAGITGPLFRKIVTSWAKDAPKSVFAYAQSLPPGIAQTTVFNAALNAEINRDPAAVINWLPQISGSANFDRTLSKLVTGTDTLLRPTSAALQWALAIQDSGLRTKALAHVVGEWARTNRAKAVRFAKTTDAVSTANRPLLLTAIKNANADLR